MNWSAAASMSSGGAGSELRSFLIERHMVRFSIVGFRLSNVWAGDGVGYTASALHEGLRDAHAVHTTRDRHPGGTLPPNTIRGTSAGGRLRWPAVPVGLARCDDRGFG